MLKKTHWTQFFKIFECFDNVLTINMLQRILPFYPSNAVSNPLTFKFLFGHSFRIVNYILFNILIELRCLFLRFPLFSNFQRAVVKFSAHSK